MTFEEFLTKKKIDAIQFKEKENVFFSEFESHFLQMGEKSFDYIKKFLFNKLRRTYHLIEEPKIIKVETKIEDISAPSPEKSGTGIANQGKPTYLPRFKSTVAQKEDSPVQQKAESATTAYVPRFKAAVQIKEQTEDTDLNKNPESEEKPKPAYKPRFKAQITVSEEQEQPETATDKAVSQPNEQVKPAYKPRFKPGLTKKDPDTE